jgi:hypothetical protein
MTEILSRCGYRCDLCLAYHPNIEKNPENQQTLSDGWFKYFGFRIPAVDIVCDGCWTEAGNLLDIECPVRPCVIEQGFNNCADCSKYVCVRLKERIVNFEDISAKFREGIPFEDRTRFIFPYESKTRLEKIRQDRSGH